MLLKKNNRIFPLFLTIFLYSFESLCQPIQLATAGDQLQSLTKKIHWAQNFVLVAGTIGLISYYLNNLHQLCKKLQEPTSLCSWVNEQIKRNPDGQIDITLLIERSSVHINSPHKLMTLFALINETDDEIQACLDLLGDIKRLEYYKLGWLATENTAILYKKIELLYLLKRTLTNAVIQTRTRHKKLIGVS